jgi:hypothetical protein
MQTTEEKQAHAQVLREEASKRTPQEQLARLDLYGHAAKKERARLEAKINPTKKEKKS